MKTALTSLFGLMLWASGLSAQCVQTGSCAFFDDFTCGVTTNGQGCDPVLWAIILDAQSESQSYVLEVVAGGDIIETNYFTGSFADNGSLLPPGGSSFLLEFKVYYGASIPESGCSVVLSQDLVLDPATVLDPADFEVVGLVPETCGMSVDGSMLLQLGEEGAGYWSYYWGIEPNPGTVLIYPDDPNQQILFDQIPAGDYILEVTAGDCAVTLELPFTIDSWCGMYPGDLNGDGTVNTSDMIAFLSNWGCVSFDCPGDLTNDSLVNVSDLVVLLGVFGTNYP